MLRPITIGATEFIEAPDEASVHVIVPCEIARSRDSRFRSVLRTTGDVRRAWPTLTRLTGNKDRGTAMTGFPLGFVRAPLQAHLDSSHPRNITQCDLIRHFRDTIGTVV